MTATLYQPNQPALIVSTNGLALPNPDGYAIISERVAELLNCSLSMVDILATGKDYIAYSIFNNEEEINIPAMIALEAITGHSFNPQVEDEMVGGRILIIHSH